METIFINSGNSKTADACRSLFNFSGKINLKRSDKNFALSNLSIYYMWKSIKKLYNHNKFEISAPMWNEKFKYLLDYILYQMFMIISSILKTWNSNHQ